MQSLIQKLLPFAIPHLSSTLVETPEQQRQKARMEAYRGACACWLRRRQPRSRHLEAARHACIVFMTRLCKMWLVQGLMCLRGQWQHSSWPGAFGELATGVWEHLSALLFPLSWRLQRMSHLRSSAKASGPCTTLPQVHGSLLRHTPDKMALAMCLLKGHPVMAWACMRIATESQAFPAGGSI